MHLVEGFYLAMDGFSYTWNYNLHKGGGTLERFDNDEY